MKVNEIIESKNETINEGIMSFIGNAIKIANLVGAGVIFYDYAKGLYTLNSRLKSKQISKQEFDKGVKEQFDTLVEKFGLILAASVFLKTFSGFSQLLRILPFGGVIASAIGLGTAAIDSVIIAIVATDKGRTLFTQLISEGILHGMTETFNQLLEDFKTIVQEAITIGKQYYNTGTIPTPKKQIAPTEPGYELSNAEKANIDAGISTKSSLDPDYSIK